MDNSLIILTAGTESPYFKKTQETMVRHYNFKTTGAMPVRCCEYCDYLNRSSTTSGNG